MIDLIKKIICAEFGITIDELHSKDRHQRVALPRHVFYYLAAKIYPNYTLSDLGALMPLKRHHSTIIHSKEVAEDLIHTGYIKNNINNINKELEHARDEILAGSRPTAQDTGVAAFGVEQDGQAL